MIAMVGVCVQLASSEIPVREVGTQRPAAARKGG